MGLVLSIERCSLHDGPGIRTTVFLKGCPLRCAWCHNPESQSARPELQLPGATCALCGECARVCPHGAHHVDAAARSHTLEPSRCRLCGACVAACPTATLKIAGVEMSAAEVVREIEKDRVYYDESGGGVTLSGGEPLFQFEFAREILAACRAQSIGTCVETCGFVSPERMRAIAPLVDLFLFDYKATGDDVHRRLTGAPLAPILDSLEILAGLNSAVILRCPLVPGVNDSPDHLRAIAALAAKHRNIQAVELMAYHDFAYDKYRRIGRTCELPNLPSADQAQCERWCELVRAAGFERVRVG